MKSKISTLFFLQFCFCVTLIHGQGLFSEYKTYTIIDELQSNNESDSQGVILIQSDPKIDVLIGNPASSKNGNAGKQEYAKMSGVRIQAFMGSDSRRSREEAFSKERLIKEIFPEISTYVTYESPNWKLLVGDFRTKEEAGVFKQSVQQAFPSFGKEMYLVTHEINIPSY